MIRFIGANPGLTILDGEQRLAFASVWRADWSQRGSGRAIVIWYGGATRVVATDAGLGLWLAQDFTRHFPEVAGLPWPTPEVEVDAVRVELDLTAGLRAEARDITVEIGPPTDRRLIRTDAFELGEVKHGLSTVYMPCETGSLRLGGTVVQGTAKAFLADAEVWSSLPAAQD